MRWLFISILCTIFQVSVAQSLYEYRYWFDNDALTVQTGQANSSDVHIDIDTSQLPSGLHTLNYQAVSEEKGESVVKSALFYKTPTCNGKNAIVLIGCNKTDDFTLTQSSQAFHLDVSTDSVSSGLHAANALLVDDSGNASSAVGTYFYKTPTYKDKNTIVLLDGKACDDFTLSQPAPSSLRLDVTADSLSSGLHIVSVKLVDDSGNASSNMESYFMRVPSNKEIEDMCMYYYIDGKKEQKEKCSIQNNTARIDLDMHSLRDGLHTVAFMLGNDGGTATPFASAYSVVKSSLFYKTPSYKDKNTIVLLDGKVCKGYTSSQQSQSSLHLDVDVDSLSLGLHSVCVLLADGKGSASSVKESYFLKVPATDGVEDLSIYYYIDDNEGQKEKCALSDNIVHVDLDLASLQEGQHTITFMLCDGKGMATQTVSAEFTKEPLTNSIMEIPIGELWDGNQPIYDLQGKKVGGKLSRGVYIIRGQKVLVR